MDWPPLVGIVASLVAAWAAFLGLLWILKPADTSLGELVRVVPDVLRLARDLVGDRSVPLGARAAVVVLVLWLVNPIDVIPEFIPVLGPLDDVVVAILVLRYVRRRLGNAGFHARWPGSDEGYALLSRVL